MKHNIWSCIGSRESAMKRECGQKPQLPPQL